MRTPSNRLVTLSLALAAATPASAAKPQDPPADGIRLTTVTLHDPENRNMESHTILVPQGWQTRGGVRWTPEMFLACAHLDVTITAPDGARVQFLPNGAFSFAEGNTGGMPLPQIGQATSGKVWMPPARSSTALVLERIVPNFRPQARDVRLVDARQIEEVARAWREQLAPLLHGQAQSNAMASQMGLVAHMRTTIEAPLVRVRYTEDGRDFEEEFSLVYLLMESAFDPGMGMGVRSCDWTVSEVKAVRAPAGELERRRPLLRTIAESLRPTETWQAMLDELNRQLTSILAETNRVTMNEIRKRSRMIFETGEEIRAMHRDSWERQQASSDRLARAWSNTMRGVDDYRLPDGTTRALDSSYDHVFANSLGEFWFSNDSMFDPNQHSSQQWQRVEPVRPMGGAANW